jgi:hypothetical protein
VADVFKVAVDPSHAEHCLHCALALTLARWAEAHGGALDSNEALHAQTELLADTLALLPPERRRQDAAAVHNRALRRAGEIADRIDRGGRGG